MLPGCGDCLFHNAAASCERAELWVHTNTIRVTAKGDEVGTSTSSAVGSSRR